MADSAANYIRGPLWDQLVQASGYHTEKINPAIDMFRQTYKSLTGQDATLDQINDFGQNGLMSAVSNPGAFGYSDMSNLVNNYVQNSAGDQIAGYQQQKQTDQLGKTQQTIQDLIGKQTAATTAQLTDPNSPTYQQFSGMMNNMGITPSSGAFQAGMGGVIGQNAANATNAALGGVSLPAISGINNTNQNPYSFAQQNSNLSHINSLSDFGLESSLAQMLQNQMQPGGFEKNLGYANTASNIFGNVAGGAKDMKGTWICTAMVRHGVMTKMEVKMLHDHLYRAFLKRPFKFIGYVLFGRFLVGLAESVKTDWRAWKPSFYQDAMSEKDPVKALDLYEEAFWNLYRVVKHRLRIKSMVLYDNPEEYRGS